MTFNYNYNKLTEQFGTVIKPSHLNVVKRVKMEK